MRILRRRTALRGWSYAISRTDIIRVCSCLVCLSTELGRSNVLLFADWRSSLPVRGGAPSAFQVSVLWTCVPVFIMVTLSSRSLCHAADEHAVFSMMELDTECIIDFVTEWWCLRWFAFCGFAKIRIGVPICMRADLRSLWFHLNMWSLLFVCFCNFWCF